MTINLTVPNLAELKPRITVFGVGGAGGNAVNNMIESRLEGVEFVVANTDAQALTQSAAQRRIQMGTALTQGLGAGSQPQIGAAAAEEAMPEILDHLAGSHMVFITAGMGGGTGTGAAPVIARAAKEQGILTVGVVTKPFHFEGVRRLQTADKGIDRLAQHVDTLIVIPNQNLFRVANEKTTFAAAFAMADQVLYSGVASITELMTKEGLINLDFADVRAIMSEMGRAMMGTGEATGDKRAIEAAEAAISNPLLDDVNMRGARGLLISISGGPDLTLYEVDEAATRIREEVDPEANIILGATFDDSLEGIMRVSVVATGLGADALGKEGGQAGQGMEEASGKTYSYSAPEAAPMPIPVGKKPVAQSPVAHPAALSPLAPRVAVRTMQSTAIPAPMAEPVEPEQDLVVPPPVPHRTMTAPRQSPGLNDFPPQNLRVIAAQQDRIENIAEHAKKKKGIFERLASVGLGRREEPALHYAEIPVMAAPRAEPRMQAQSPQVPHQAQAKPVHQASHHQTMVNPAMAHHAMANPAAQASELDLDDDQLEIPAFLRRQAK